ncbi:MAG: carboxypeptidase-like regulatory domain-containing protein, partial [Polyangiaceae bacterium]|nr:carboxypeptidase-like regulatory domain-containing protein [Polyangiaceae bacterium]
MFINAGCGPIAKLLQSIGQTYSHEAIMTQNYYGLAHSTASKDYLTADIPKDERAVGYNRFTEHRLRYAWPGALKESVDEAFNGARYLADDGKVYSMNTFNPEPQQCEGFSTSYPILVIRPPLESDSLVRPILHQAADIAKAAESHYRFFAFTQGNVSFDPPQNYSSRPVVPGYTNQYPLNTSFRSPSGEPATVSTTFLWDALKRAGATLEGCQFEDSDGSINDRRDTFWVGLPYASDTDCTSPRIGGTVDGLYWYREALRDVAGQAVYDATYNDVAAEIAKGGGNAVFVAGVAGHFIGDHARSFAHQMLNCFAYDACSENLVGDDSTRYDPTVEGSRSPLPFGDGVSVSPDDFLMWDTPAQGGVYGQSEKAQLRSGEYRRIHRWRAAEGTFTVVGQVLRAGAPVAGATVEVGPAVTVSDVNGNFRVAGVEGGNVSVRAQKTIDGESYTDEELVQVSASTPLVVLELTAESSRPPEGLVLYARRVNITGNTRIKDDEGFGETDQFKDTPINAFCEVSPLMRRTALTLRSECAGGEAWGESTVECLLLPNNQDVQVVLNVKLYEGTSCGTTDLDGTAPPALIPSLAPGQNAPIGTRANNDVRHEAAADQRVPAWRRSGSKSRQRKYRKVVVSSLASCIARCRAKR